MTGINRRQFSQLLTGSLLLPGNRLVFAGGKASPLFASAAQDRQGSYHLYLIDSQGNVQLDHPLPARAHHVEAHLGKPWLACTARRPGTFIDLVNYKDGQLIKRISSATGRHFFGHAIFSTDGQYLIATENNISDGLGRIVVRRAEGDFAIVADMPSYGIGPHELQLIPGSNRLMVANGGILTHPDSGRKKLNLDTMQPSLVTIDFTSAQLLDQQYLPDELHHLSIRHLDCNARGDTVIALQYQGGVENNPPLVAVHRAGQSIKLLAAPEPVNLAMKHYCGSARFDASGRFAAISAPRGDLVTFWDLQSDSFHSAIKSRDGCGLSATAQAGNFLITTGRGHCTQHNLLTGLSSRLPQAISTAWDNHMTGITL
ncbi:MAG: DUF1513 domain-containing protein [Amphritea sp.]